MERASVFEGIQIAVETVPGTAVPANKRLLCTTISPKPSIGQNNFRPNGSKAATVTIPRKEYSEGSIDGVLAFNDLCYLLSCLLCTPVITTPDGATNTRRWTFTPANFGPDAPKSLTVEKGSSAGAERIPGVVVNGLTININDTDAKVTGSILGRLTTPGARMSTNEVQTITISAEGGTFKVTYSGQQTAGIAYNAAASTVQTALAGLSSIGTGNVLVTKEGAVYTVEFTGTLGQKSLALMTTDPASLTGGAGTAVVAQVTDGGLPTDIDAVVVMPKNTSIYVADSEAELDALTGLLQKCLEAEIAITDRFSPLMTINAAEPSFAATVEKPPTLSGKLVVEYDSVGAAMMENLRDAETKFCRIVISQGLVETGFPYRIVITFPFKFANSDPGDQQDVFANTFDLLPIYDPDFLGFVEVIVDTDLTAL